MISETIPTQTQCKECLVFLFDNSSQEVNIKLDQLI